LLFLSFGKLLHQIALPTAIQLRLEAVFAKVFGDIALINFKRDTHPKVLERRQQYDRRKQYGEKGSQRNNPIVLVQ
jgi:hypothetical protein